jgi:hypothetical protein
MGNTVSIAATVFGAERWIAFPGTSSPLSPKKLNTHHVFLTGISYGGDRVHRHKVARQEGVDTSCLHVRTYGSIYIPKHRSVAGVDMTHLLKA